MKTTLTSGFLASALVLALLAPEAPAAATERIVLNLGTAVPLQCQNPGSQQDVAKTPVIKNTTGATIPKSHLIRWATNSGDKGEIHLEADLAPGATVIGQGGAGNGYQCSATFQSMPDLVPWKAEWQGTSALKVEVKNLDPWVPTDGSVVRVQVMSCSGAVLQAYDSAPLAIAGGQVKAVTVPATFVPGKAYLRITADATTKVLERNEVNNVMDGSGSCIH